MQAGDGLGRVALLRSGVKAVEQLIDRALTAGVSVPCFERDKIHRRGDIERDRHTPDSANLIDRSPSVAPAQAELQAIIAGPVDVPPCIELLEYLHGQAFARRHRGLVSAQAKINTKTPRSVMASLRPVKIAIDHTPVNDGGEEVVAAFVVHTDQVGFPARSTLQAQLAPRERAEDEGVADVADDRPNKDVAGDPSHHAGGQPAVDLGLQAVVRGEERIAYIDAEGGGGEVGGSQSDKGFHHYLTLWGAGRLGLIEEGEYGAGGGDPEHAALADVGSRRRVAEA